MRAPRQLWHGKPAHSWGPEPREEQRRQLRNPRWPPSAALIVFQLITFALCLRERAPAGANSISCKTKRLTGARDKQAEGGGRRVSLRDRLSRELGERAGRSGCRKQAPAPPMGRAGPT